MADQAQEKGTLEIEVRTRNIRRVDAEIPAGAKIDPARIIAAVRERIDTATERAYAFKIGMPGLAPGSVEIQSYDNEGRSLDQRSFHVEVKPDGAASLTISANRGQKWHLVGVFTHQVWAEMFGDLWKAGAIQVDFAKLARPAAAEQAA